ncbi:MAG: hypothetical protein LH630_10520 [Actinomycetia bacterium]|nr:hypothetical protein [Actinomycetes bacterium]
MTADRPADSAAASEATERTPVTPHHLHLPDWRPAMVGALSSGIVLVGALLALPWLWAPVIALQVVVVLTWHRSLGTPSAASGAVVGAGLAAIVDVIVAGTDEAPSLGPIAVVLGAGYLIAVIQQLLRQDGRADLVDALAATVTLATVAALGAAWVVLVQLEDGNSTTVILAGACAAAAVGRLAPGVAGAAVVPLGAGVVAGALVGAAVDETQLGAGLGLAAAVPVALAAVTQARVRGEGAGWLTGGVWPVLLAAPLGYLVVRLTG